MLTIVSEIQRRGITVYSDTSPCTIVHWNIVSFVQDISISVRRLFAQNGQQNSMTKKRKNSMTKKKVIVIKSAFCYNKIVCFVCKS